MARLSVHEQKTLLYSTIRALSKQHLSTGGPSQDSNGEAQSKAIGGAAAFVKAIVGDLIALQDHLVEWLVGVSAHAISQGHVAHRAVTAALSSKPGEYLKPALHFCDS